MTKAFYVITICLLNFAFYGQKPQLLNKKNTIKYLNESPPTVSTGKDKEFDDAVKFALDKYWTFSKLKYVKDASIRGFGISNLGSRNGGKKYEWTYFYMNNGGFNYNPNFDAFKKGDNNEGLDSNYHMMSIKVIQFIMVYCAELKKIQDLGEESYKTQQSLKDKVKNYNIIIPKENVTNKRFTEEPLKTNLNKYELVDSETIYKKLKGQETTPDNTGLLFIGRNDYGLFLSIMDMKTGELLYTEGIGLGTFSQGKGFNDETMNNLLKNLKD